MIGTEKQIKWAEDIKASTLATIASNVELNKKRIEEYPASRNYFEEELAAWEYMAERYAVMFQHPKFDNAKFVIDNRDNIVFHPVDVSNKANIYRSNKGISMLEATKKIIG